MENKCSSLILFNSVLLISSVILILISFIPNSGSNLELNLGTELTGIFLTITLIDWIIKRNNEKKWKKSKKLLLKKVLKFNNKFNAVIRYFSGNKTPIPRIKPTKENIINFNIELLKFNEKNVLPEIQKSILSFQPKQWKTLFEELKELNEYLIQTMLLFGEKINPKIHSDLLSIQIFLEEILSTYDAIPELFLYPPQKLTQFQLTMSNNSKKQFVENLEYSLKTSIKMNKKLVKDGYKL